MTPPEPVCQSAFQAAVHANTRCVWNTAQHRSLTITVTSKFTDQTECISTGTYAIVKQHKHIITFVS